MLYAHAAPEADISTVVYMCFYTAVGIVFAAVVGAYVMPVLGTFFIGPEGIQIRRGAPVRGVPNRLRMPSPPKPDPDPGLLTRPVASSTRRGR